MVAHPEVLEQLRDKLVADADSFNVLEGNTKRPEWLGRGGPPESSGRGSEAREASESSGSPQRLLDEVR